jgi:hypothetical protein|nr:MAG TPA: hypothetical protein [Caudoviricetes sp.]
MANLVTFAKKLWKDATSGGTPITAAELNRMEGGINDCATQINRLGDSVSQRLGDIQEASYSARAWFVIGKGEDDADRRGLCWSDNELFIMRGGKYVAKVTLTPMNASSDQAASDQAGPELR